MNPTNSPKDNTAVNANRLAQIEKMEAKVRVKAEAKGFDVSKAVYVLQAFIPKEDQGKVFSRPFVAIFDDRVVQVRKSFFGPSDEEIPISRISSVSITSGLMPVVSVYTSGNTMVFETDVLQGPRFVEVLKGLLSKEPKSTPQSGTSDVDQLEKLASLLEKGHITKAEFTAKKKQILGL
jgi:hypothetical protein